MSTLGTEETVEALSGSYMNVWGISASSYIYHDVSPDLRQAKGHPVLTWRSLFKSSSIILEAACHAFPTKDRPWQAGILGSIGFWRKLSDPTLNFESWSICRCIMQVGEGKQETLGTPPRKYHSHLLFTPRFRLSMHVKCFRADPISLNES